MPNIINPAPLRQRLAIRGEQDAACIAAEDIKAFDLVTVEAEWKPDYWRDLENDSATNAGCGEYAISEDGSFFFQYGGPTSDMYFHYRKEGDTDFTLLPETTFSSLYPFDTTTRYYLTGGIIVDNRDIYISVSSRDTSTSYPADFVGIMKFRFNLETATVSYVGSVTNLNNGSSSTKVLSIALHPSKKFIIASVYSYKGAFIDIESEIPNLTHWYPTAKIEDGGYEKSLISPNGNHYVGVSHDKIAVWKIAAGDRTLTKLFSERYTVHAYYETDDLSISADSKYILFSPNPFNKNIRLLDISDENSIQASVSISSQLQSFTSATKAHFDPYDARLFYAGKGSAYRLNEDKHIVPVSTMLDNIYCLKIWWAPYHDYIIVRDSIAVSTSSVKLYTLKQNNRLYKLQLPVAKPATIGYVRKNYTAGSEAAYKEILTITEPEIETLTLK